MPCSFYYEETSFKLEHNPAMYEYWIEILVKLHQYRLGEIDYIFCSDDYLLKINKESLNHNTYTDILSFDYTVSNIISGEIYISIDRIEENSRIFHVTFEDELIRVMSHGVLHFFGYKDKEELDVKIMRNQELESIKLYYKIIKNK